MLPPGILHLSRELQVMVLHTLIQTLVDIVHALSKNLDCLILHLNPLTQLPEAANKDGDSSLIGLHLQRLFPFLLILTRVRVIVWCAFGGHLVVEVVLECAFGVLRIPFAE